MVERHLSAADWYMGYLDGAGWRRSAMECRSLAHELMAL
jgi:hypothetical protein